MTVYTLNIIALYAALLYTVLFIIFVIVYISVIFAQKNLANDKAEKERSKE